MFQGLNNKKVELITQIVLGKPILQGMIPTLLI